MNENMMVLEKNKKDAAIHFERLLLEQLGRVEALKKQEPVMDFSKLDAIVIGACSGDGIGPIILREAVRVLEHLLKDSLQSGKIIIKEIQGLTLENRIACGKTVPDEVMADMKECHVLLKGPTTTPQAGAGIPNMESANVTIRREFDLFANVRPVSVPELGIDWVFFRENTEGEYILGSQGFEIPGKLAFDFKVTTDEGTCRIAKTAFEYAKNNGKTNVAIVTKANILKKTDGKFLDICKKVAKDYPDINLEEWYVDIMSANLINKEMQSKFQVFVLPNLYGDIITDEAAQIQGGVGTAGSSNIGSNYAMFEAIHGSAPRMMTEGLGEYANPSSILKAVEMLLCHIGYVKEAKRLSTAMKVCEQEGKIIITGTSSGATCKEFANYLISNL